MHAEGRIKGKGGWEIEETVHIGHLQRLKKSEQINVCLGLTNGQSKFRVINRR